MIFKNTDTNSSPKYQQRSVRKYNENKGPISTIIKVLRIKGNAQEPCKDFVKRHQ